MKRYRIMTVNMIHELCIDKATEEPSANRNPFTSNMRTFVRGACSCGWKREITCSDPKDAERLAAEIVGLAHLQHDSGQKEEVK